MKIFHWPNRSTYIAVGVFLLVFVLGAALNECSAAEYEVGAGVAVGPLADSCNPAAVVEATALFYDRHVDVSAAYVGDQCTGDDEEGNVGEFWYTSVQGVVHPFGHDAPWFMGLGLMYLVTEPDGPYVVMPQRWNFSLSVGADIGRWRVEARHFSNAGLEEPNRGQNHVVVGYRF